MTDDRRVDKPVLQYFDDIVGHPPFPWQRELYAAFSKGEIPEAVDVPTGLGKTLSVLLFLLARLKHPDLPTRVVYAVDRRAIVDQTASTIRSWIDSMVERPGLARAFDAMAAFQSDRPVRLGVLRGGLADDGEWRVDPARPAVVVGTVDTIGSRIMFSGYGDGLCRRPMHAGLLGYDSIVMLDEAHFSPATERLLRSVERIQGCPRFRTLALSGAPRTGTGTGRVIGLTPNDEAVPEVRRRLHGIKRPEFREARGSTDLVGQMCKAAAARKSGSVAVFAGTVERAEKITGRLKKMLGTGSSVRVALLTGTLRGKECEELANGAVWKQFAPGRKRGLTGDSVYLVMTPAGEVGVDLDADHGIMDLATLDSMIQRLGRVNRTGAAKAEISLVFEEKEAEGPKSKAKNHAQRLARARSETLKVLRRLDDLSVESLRSIDNDTHDVCATPPVRFVRLGRETVEVYAATAADLQLPDVSNFLQGLSDASGPPDCHLVWRRDVADLVGRGEKAAREAISIFRPDARETARVPSGFAQKLVELAIARQGGFGLPLIVWGSRSEVFTGLVKSADTIPSLDHATVFLPPTAGGLEASGLPSLSASEEVSDVGDNDERLRFISGRDGVETVGGGAAPILPEWLDSAVTFRMPLHDPGEEDVEERYLVYAVRPPEAAAGESDPTRLSVSNQTVKEHCALVGDAARRIGTALDLPEADALETAGRWHDLGKARSPWQRAAGIPRGGRPLANPPDGHYRPALLEGYRHEFGSLAEAGQGIPTECADFDLILHLIASHHGWARPGYPDRRQWDPDMPSVRNQKLAFETAVRFARLQARYGPWRLAWLEALLKAADAHGSTRGGR